LRTKASHRRNINGARQTQQPVNPHAHSKEHTKAQTKLHDGERASNLTIQKGKILARHVFHVDKPCQKKIGPKMQTAPSSVFRASCNKFPTTYSSACKSNLHSIIDHKQYQGEKSEYKEKE
jgi:hypothetical protein